MSISRSLAHLLLLLSPREERREKRKNFCGCFTQRDRRKELVFLDSEERKEKKEKKFVVCLLFRTYQIFSFFIGERERENDDDDERMRTEDQNQKRERGDDDVENNNNKINAFSRVHVYDNENKRLIQNDWGRDPFFWATPKVFAKEILNARAVENTNESVWEIEDRRIVGGAKHRNSDDDDDEKKKKTKRIIRRIRKCELCGVIVEFTTRKDSKIFLSLDDGTGVIECVIWAPSTITSSEDNNTSFGFVDEEEENYYTLNQVERDPFGRMVADDGVLLLHGKLRLGETVFVQGRVSLYNGKKQIVVNSMQMICEREGLARERDLETLFWLDVVEQRMDKGY